jgi:hypothetical protein
MNRDDDKGEWMVQIETNLYLKLFYSAVVYSWNFKEFVNKDTYMRN